MNNFILIIIFSSVALTKSSPFEQAKYRLSGNTKPTFYSIKIHPDLERETFTGEVSIHVNVATSSASIEFHLNRTYLEITRLYFDTKQTFHVSYNCYCNPSWNDFGYEYSDYELVKIVRSGGRLIPPGAHIIHIYYNGKLSKGKEGIFKSGCSQSGTVLSHIVATDLQPTYARQVFPCFDEPSYKAKFQLNLVVPDLSYVALSNMRPMETVNISDGIIYKFEPSPPMSTYLLSFAITRHSYVEFFDEDGKPFRLYSFNASNIEDDQLLNFSSQIINFYANYTKFGYKLPKIDFLGFDRYETAATENWGLVTFNTSLLSSKDDFYDTYQKQAVIAHELAHFWFGNLVTNSWWDDIWLHESFATFMGMKAEDFILNNGAYKVFPSVYMMNLFYTEQTEFSTPVVYFQEDPVTIRKNFNDVTYIKGACLLRMLELIIGESKMREIISEYVHKFAFKTASTNDFLSIVDSHTQNVNLRPFMESYLYQSRFPLVYVEEENGRYVLRQKSFGADLNRSDDAVLGHKWTIPLTYITNLDNNWTLVWLYPDVDHLYLPNDNVKWIKFNYRQTGYYRVLYSKSLWSALTEHSQEMEQSERDYLLLEAIGSFEINLLSCDVVLRYLWELSNVTETSTFNIEYAFTAYIRINEVIKNYDGEAAQNLKIFFGHVLQRARKPHVAKRFLKGSAYSGSEKRNKRATGEVKACVEWLKSESIAIITLP